MAAGKRHAGQAITDISHIRRRIDSAMSIPVALTTMIGDHKHVVHDRCAMDVRRLAAAIQDAEDASARKTLDAIAAGTERLVTVSAAAPYGRSFDQDATACSL